MSFTDKKREEIKKYILRKIARDDKEFIDKTMDNFGISITSVKRYLQDMLVTNMISEEKDTECGYHLVEEVFLTNLTLDENFCLENDIFEEYIFPHLTRCNADAVRIWQYVCEEMLNNAIEHSKGHNLVIEVICNVLAAKVVIIDDGLGTFRTLLRYMETSGWNKPRIEDALVELYKGKITCNAAAHSGEGIFFSSKMVDEYVLWSDSCMYIGKYGNKPKSIESHLLAYASRIGKIGTMVCMSLENDISRKITEVFNMYSDVENGLIKTRIPVLEACIHGEPVARSQARRICNRLDEFKEDILDFAGVEFMGQGFSDEIFRVYATAHPQVVLRPINMDADVRRMVFHVGRGNLPQNVEVE